MSVLSFKSNDFLSIGTEIELQLINPRDFSLMPVAKSILRHVFNEKFHKNIKPEITQCMIELNSSVHSSPASLHEELVGLTQYLLNICQELNILCCGG